MRALLVVNQQATTTSRHSREVLVRALRSEVELEVAYTARRGHGIALAREAAVSGVGLVVAHGGDGTVNEVVNGLMAARNWPGMASTGAAGVAGAGIPETGAPTGAGTGPGTVAGWPALAVVPGGSTNVFARALGLPREWADATGVILEALREERTRTIGLGLARGVAGPAHQGGERYFTFCVGLGLDAAVIRQVEQARLRGRTATASLYLRATVDRLLRDRTARRATITLAGPDQHAGQLTTVIVQNTAPWTYLGDRPIDPNPGASFDLGLDILALRALRVPSTARTFGQMLSRRRAPHGKQVLRWHDLPDLTVHASHPLPFQIDGDYLGEQQKVQLRAVPKALRVVC